MDQDQPAKKPKRARESAGILLYRQGAEGLEVLLVHPSGWYNAKSPWSIPKGLREAEETLEEAARRETLEETGVATSGELVALDFVTYKSGKRVYGFCGPLPDGARPFCASWEIDRAEFFSLTAARQVLHPAQMDFLDALERHLGSAAGQTSAIDQAQAANAPA